MSDKKTKTNHKTGWHKRVVNPTTNYAKDTHKAFCKRCLHHNEGCPVSKSGNPTAACSL